MFALLHVLVEVGSITEMVGAAVNIRMRKPEPASIF